MKKNLSILRKLNRKEVKMDKIKKINFKGIFVKGLVSLLFALALYGLLNWTWDNHDVLTYTILQPEKVRLMKNYQILKLEQADSEFKQMFEIIEELKEEL